MIMIGVQCGQRNPNPRVHRSSVKLGGLDEFPTGTVDLRVEINLTPMINSFSHISSFTIYMARYCVLPLATYTVSDVRYK